MLLLRPEYAPAASTARTEYVYVLFGITVLSAHAMYVPPTVVIADPFRKIW